MSGGTQFYWYDSVAEQEEKREMAEGIPVYATGDNVHNAAAASRIHLSGKGYYSAVNLDADSWFKFTGHSPRQSDVPSHIPGRFRYGPFKDEHIVVLHDATGHERKYTLEGAGPYELGRDTLTEGQALGVARIAATLPTLVKMPEIRGFRTGSTVPRRRSYDCVPA